MPHPVTRNPYTERDWRRELGIGRPSRYSRLADAWRAIDTRYTNPGSYTTALGDDGKVWVITRAEAARLRAGGYEIVNRRGEPY